MEKKIYIHILIELSNLLLFRSRLKNNDIKEFPLKKYLMRPYLGSESIEDIRKKKFNYLLCKGRSVHLGKNCSKY